MRIYLPRTLVIATDCFDEFIRENGLQYVINSDISDDEILSEFVSSRLPESLVDDLRIFIRHSSKPLAVRSSSKLEDSHYQPFAGIYSTYMIPMTSNEDQTLRLLGKAIKSVYASVYRIEPRLYPGDGQPAERGEDGRRDPGGVRDGRQRVFFPTISGVARSLNFYPIGDEKPQDGIVNLAFGLGKLVVDGGQTLRFSPRYPKNVLQLSTPELALSETQREMYALNLKPEEFKTSIDDAVNLQRFEINKAKHFRNMRHVASTWDMQNQRITDSTFEDGRKIVTFSRILKYDTIPLAQIVCDLLEMGEKRDALPDRNGVCRRYCRRIFPADVPIRSRTFRSTGRRYPPTARWSCRTRSRRDRRRMRRGLYSQRGVRFGAHAADRRRDRRAEQPDACRKAFLRADRPSDPWLGIPVKSDRDFEAKVIVDSKISASNRVKGTHFFPEPHVVRRRLHDHQPVPRRRSVRRGLSWTANKPSTRANWCGMSVLRSRCTFTSTAAKTKASSAKDDRKDKEAGNGPGSVRCRFRL